MKLNAQKPVQCCTSLSKHLTWLLHIDLKITLANLRQELFPSFAQPNISLLNAGFFVEQRDCVHLLSSHIARTVWVTRKCPCAVLATRLLVSVCHC